MKYKIDPEWGVDRAIEKALKSAPAEVRYERISTSGGRQILLLMADAPANAVTIYKALNVDIWAEGLQNSRGLCTMLFRAPKRNVCRISAVYDGVVGVFATDTGFRRGPKSEAVTAAHEAVHAGQRLAAKELCIPHNNTGVFTREHEELTAQWAGYLAIEFIKVLRVMPEAPFAQPTALSK